MILHIYTFTGYRETIPIGSHQDLITSEHKLEADEVGTRTVVSAKRQFPRPPYFRECRSLRCSDGRRHIHLHHLFNRRGLIHQDQHAPAAYIDR